MSTAHIITYPMVYLVLMYLPDENIVSKVYHLQTLYDDATCADAEPHSFC